MANSVDADQMTCFALSDLGLDCLQKAYLSQYFGLLRYSFDIDELNPKLSQANHFFKHSSGPIIHVNKSSAKRGIIRPWQVTRCST